MTHQWRHDPNAWHFMSLPTGIAMGDNGNFATCPGVFDANHNGGDPFTGPSLWSADTAIYAHNSFGPLGSHLDMLHVNANSQGIAHERWNRYWVVDGFRGDIVMNDFRTDHGPGNDYHGNAIIRRYADITVTKDPNDHVVSHNVFDKRNGMLYVVDFGGQRVLRINTTTGTVSDHANGDIIIYDFSGSGTPELGRIHTGVPGIMGVKVGPDGRIWYVNASTHALVRLDPQEPSAVREQEEARMMLYPNPAGEAVTLEMESARPGTPLMVHDPQGRCVARGVVAGPRSAIDVSALVPGAYLLRVAGAAGMRTLKFTVAR